MPKTARLSEALFLLFIAVLSAPACSKNKADQQMKKTPVPVTAGSATLMTIPVQIRSIGNVEAYSTVAIKAQVGGQLSKVHFREGQDVKKGDLLFTIDPRPYETQIRQYEAVLARDRAQMEHAREEARRYEELVKKGYVARDQYEQFRTNALALEATVSADRELLENARLQLAYCFITAPVSGRTGSLLANEGNLIKANADTSMVVIHQIQPVYVTFSVPEKNLSDIRKRMQSGGLGVTVALPSQGQYQEKGLLTFIENTVDLTTGSIKLKGTFENRDKKLWPGQFVNTTLTLAEIPRAVVVPSAAVQTGQQGQYLFVIKEDTAELRQVSAGVTYEGFTLIEKGVADGEQVVTDGQMRIAPGAKIEIRKPARPEAAAPGPAAKTAEPAPAAKEKIKP
ncbi:MAG: efflux RND transporter periplasmic adaptor subunit [Nitrospirae bacterium]|nr:MAG: efflux RND transporter periplasmic adaptor subunit [Nitrospirota bacterium]